MAYEDDRAANVRGPEQAGTPMNQAMAVGSVPGEHHHQPDVGRDLGPVVSAVPASIRPRRLAHATTVAWRGDSPDVQDVARG